MSSVLDFLKGLWGHEPPQSRTTAERVAMELMSWVVVVDEDGHGILARGALSEAARTVGCSRQYVAQVAKRLGYEASRTK